MLCSYLKVSCDVTPVPIKTFSLSNKSIFGTNEDRKSVDRMCLVATSSSFLVPEDSGGHSLKSLNTKSGI